MILICWDSLMPPIPPPTAGPVVAGLIGVAAFVAGQHNHSSGVTVLTGLAYTGGQPASVVADGYAYGFEGVGSVDWADSQGVTHMGSWPSCLEVPGHDAPDPVRVCAAGGAGRDGRACT